MKTLRDKVVWITGASSGIGRALALAAHRQSAVVILSARRAGELDAVAKQCTGEARVHVLPMDVTDDDSLPAKAAAALQFAGRVDMIVHNAGVAARDLAIDTSVEVDRRVMETNYFGAVALTKLLLPSMIERRSGTFLVVSSITGKFGAARLGAYCASKHALHGFFDSLRAEVRTHGIQVTIAVPGFINTPITENALTGNGDRFGRLLSVHLRGMAPDECARRMLCAVAKGKEEVLVGGHEVRSVTLLRISRRLVAVLVRNYPFRAVERVRRWFAFRASRRVEEDDARSW